ncbi:hypothetical protein DRI96_05295 [Candidatus Aerophobetes bacterium]|uniref:HTH marR-type domain-containing protein n=1 Tax=Aerophobetes bacterium TaxID=2030807 RepID=A0A662D950_UNCAE|nr:MAG: hypothetical protein DRI96_05295 [Candidatus Aerophobetes bacterium]
MEEEVQREAIILDELISNLAKVFGMKEIDDTLDIEINFAQAQVLRQIYILKEPKMSELGKVTGIQLSTLTRIVDKLVQKEFVMRKTDPLDRRVVRVSVTSLGEKIIKKIEETKRKKIASILRKLTPDERKKILQVLQVLYKRISNEVKNES